MSDLLFTPIYEAARLQLQIDRDEYAVLNYVQTWSSHPANRYPGYCDRTQEQIAQWAGMTVRGLRKMCERLIEADLLQQNDAHRLYRITTRWFETVNQARISQLSQPFPDSDNGESEPEQSSGGTGTKFRPEPEQSSDRNRNKVPIHSNSNSKSNSKGSKDKHAHANDEIAEIIQYLNELTDSEYKPNSKATRSAISARMGEGWKIDDFKAVIKNQTIQWKDDPEFCRFLRPETLFRPTKFEGYVMAARRAVKAGLFDETGMEYTIQARPKSANTPDALKKEISLFYHKNPEVWQGAKAYAGALEKPQTWFTENVLKFCARQVSQQRTADTFGQYNGRLQEWLLREMEAPDTIPGTVTIETPKSRQSTPVKFRAA